MRRALALACAVTAGAVLAASGVAQAAAPLRSPNKSAAIPGQYIVVMKDDASAVATKRATSVATARDGKILLQYRSALKGYAANLSPQALAAVRKDPGVAFVEADTRGDEFAFTTQFDAPWGLDRIDQRKLPLDTRYRYGLTGAGVKAYIIDSGIRFVHSEFEGGPFPDSQRAISGWNAYPSNHPGTRPADDCYGHGTNVAGIVGGTRYGAAKQVKLVAVKVSQPDCAGDLPAFAQGIPTSIMIAGVNWVTADHKSGERAVANMSIGASINSSNQAATALDLAVKNSIADGIIYVLAAGNDHSATNAGNACVRSPQRVPEALTVGATTANDTIADYSNRGDCVDLYAPGSGIMSASYTASFGFDTGDGTSLAAPFVAGVAARYLSSGSKLAPAAVAEQLRLSATQNIVRGIPAGPGNRLLFLTDDPGQPE